MLYNSFILPHFKYLNSLWCNTSQQNINSLQLLQNRAMRVILRCRSRMHIDDMLKKLHFLNISEMCYFDTCVLMYKIKHGLVPCYLNFNDNLDFHHNYNLRSKSKSNMYRNRCHKFSLAFHGAQYWNILASQS